MARSLLTPLLVLVLSVLSACSSSEGEFVDSFGRCSDFDELRQVYWGDTHLHTGMSFDAGAFGARLQPADAYRFARGEQLKSSTGLQVKLSRPLDFLVVADHSDMMGFATDFVAGAPVITATEQGGRWYELFSQGGEGATTATLELIGNFAQGTLDPALVEAYAPGGTAYAGAWGEACMARMARRMICSFLTGTFIASASSWPASRPSGSRKRVCSRWWGKRTTLSSIEGQ